MAKQPTSAQSGLRRSSRIEAQSDAKAKALAEDRMTAPLAMKLGKKSPPRMTKQASSRTSVRSKVATAKRKTTAKAVATQDPTACAVSRPDEWAGSSIANAGTLSRQRHVSHRSPRSHTCAVAKTAPRRRKNKQNERAKKQKVLATVDPEASPFPRECKDPTLMDSKEQCPGARHRRRSKSVGRNASKSGGYRSSFSKAGHTHNVCRYLAARAHQSLQDSRVQVPRPW